MAITPKSILNKIDTRSRRLGYTDFYCNDYIYSDMVLILTVHVPPYHGMVISR